MLELKNIKVEVGGKVVVDTVSLAVVGGTVSMLMGPNGSGKSSMVNAILGHPQYKITHGNILLDGEDITVLPTEKKAQKGIFLSLQHIPKIGGVSLAVFLHKVHQTLGGKTSSVLEYYAELMEIAGRFSIDKSLLDRPLITGLSGGERKLSEIIQLIALKPKVAILDEVDSGVDVDAMRKVTAAIEYLKKEGTAFIIISHNPSLLAHMTPNNVHVMGNGKLVRSDGADLANLILAKGFCSVLDCEYASNCKGACDTSSL